MKDNACLINTARGGIVDEEALSKALAGKVIRSACFDVLVQSRRNLRTHCLRGKTSI